MPRISSNGKILLKDKLYNMYMDREFVDTEILVEDGIISAHCVVLAGESPIIAQMVQHQRAEPKTLNLRQFSKLVMRYILEYMYKGDIMCHIDDETRFKEAAEFLQLQGFNSVKREPSSSPRAERVITQAPIVPVICISDESNSSHSKSDIEEIIKPRKRIKLNKSAGSRSESTRTRPIAPLIADSNNSDAELEDSSPDFCLRVSKKKSVTNCDKNKKGNSSKKRSEESIKLNKTHQNKVSNIPESTTPDNSLLLIENPPSIVEISELTQVNSVPVQREDLGSSETTIHTDDAENSSLNVEPPQSPERNEQPQAETSNPPDVDNETHPAKSDKGPKGIWRSKHNSKKFGRSFCVICNKNLKRIKTHIKLNHKPSVRKAKFKCLKCYKNFYFEIVLKDHRENYCKDE
ncbi:unnamed protein product [Diabrotica balteata]|uniref:BTB domain-containing protein n=1 Tax=Diabrotica balteata TaxID=107213 RepID=A0A9N9X8J1_DIABA|nr:unnamed protein product [Diabrotica balteata]